MTEPFKLRFKQVADVPDSYVVIEYGYIRILVHYIKDNLYRYVPNFIVLRQDAIENNLDVLFEALDKLSLGINVNREQKLIYIDNTDRTFIKLKYNIDLKG